MSSNSGIIAEGQVAEIRALLELRVTKTAVAQKFGMSRERLYQIIRENFPQFIDFERNCPQRKTAPANSQLQEAD